MSPEAVVERMLAALANPEGGVALLELHAPEAWLLLGEESVQRSGMDPVAFAAFHRGAVAAVRDGLPPGPAKLVSWTAEGASGVGVFELAGGERLGVGLVQAGEGWLIGWASVLGDRPAPAYAAGRALALAEFPFRHGAAARSWLDVGYRRAYGLPETRLDVLEGERYSCQGTGGCCRAAWEIALPAEAQRFLDALPYEDFAPELAGTRLEAKEDGSLVLKRRDEGCRFLDEQQRCRIHALLGTPVFTPCVTFPYRFTATPDGVAVTTRYYCHGVQGGFGPLLQDQPAEIRRRLAQAGPMVALGVPRLQQEGPEDWAAFQAAEAELREALRYPGLPLHRRLWIGNGLLAGRMEGLALDMDELALESLDPLDEHELAFLQTYLPYMIGIIAMVHPGLEGAQQLKFNGIKLRDEPRMTRWLENVLFAKELSYAFGLTVAHTVTVLLYATLLAAESAGPVDEDALRALYTTVDHGMLIPPLRQLFELVPALHANLDRPVGAALLLRLLQQGS